MSSRVRPPSRPSTKAGAISVSYRARRGLLKANEALTERERRRLCALFEREPMIADAWGLKEAFRSIYKAPDRREAERRLDHFLAAVARAQLPAFAAFADGVRLWRAELLAYFDEPTTRGYAEGVINKVNVIKRRAYGPPSFDAFRDPGPPSMRLSGTTRRHPARSTRSETGPGILSTTRAGMPLATPTCL